MRTAARSAVGRSPSGDGQCGIVEELAALSLVPSHAHVVRFLGYVRLSPHRRGSTLPSGARQSVDYDTSSVLVVQELLDGGDLSDKILERPVPSFDQRRRWAIEIAEVLRASHMATSSCPSS